MKTRASVNDSGEDFTGGVAVSESEVVAKFDLWDVHERIWSPRRESG